MTESETGTDCPEVAASLEVVSMFSSAKVFIGREKKNKKIKTEAKINLAGLKYLEDKNSVDMYIF